jgi:hypothetical protein
LYSKILLIIFLSISISLVSAQTSQFILSAKIPDTFYEGDIPKITGKVLDQSHKPVSDAKVQIQYPTEIVETTSKGDGSFDISPTKPMSLGLAHGTSIIISKNGFTMGFFPIEYSVIEKPQLSPVVIPENTALNQTIINNTNSSITDLSQLQQELLSTILKEQNNTNEKNDDLSTQRIIAQKSLDQDIAKSEKEFEKYNPFNVFSRFVENFDDSIRNIFLGQFAVTQKQHEEGQKALNEALNSGQSSQMAMNAFNDKAKISRDTIIELNNNINHDYKPINRSENTTKLK